MGKGFSGHYQILHRSIERFCGPLPYTVLSFIPVLAAVSFIELVKKHIPCLVGRVSGGQLRLDSQPLENVFIDAMEAVLVRYEDRGGKLGVAKSNPMPRDAAQYVPDEPNPGIARSAGIGLGSSRQGQPALFDCLGSDIGSGS